MPRTAITVTTSTRSGATQTWIPCDATNHHEFDNSTQKVLIIIDNTGGASSITPTFLTPQTVGEETLAVADLTGVAVAAGAIQAYGPFGNTTYGQDTSPKKVYVNVAGSDAANANITAIALGAI